MRFTVVQNGSVRSQMAVKMAVRIPVKVKCQQCMKCHLYVRSAVTSALLQ